MLKVLIEETQDEVTKLIFNGLAERGDGSQWLKIENKNGGIAGLVIYKMKEKGVARILYFIQKGNNPHNEILIFFINHLF